MSMDLTFKPFSGVGIITFYGRDEATGLPNTGGWDLGEPGQLELTNTAPRQEMNTMRAADRGVAFSWAGAKAGAVSIQVRTVSDFIWKLLMGANYDEVAAASAVTDWEAPAGLAVGQWIRLPHANVSAVTVKDSAGSPATLALNTHYELDAVTGMIRILNLASFVQPLTVDYTPGAVKVLSGMQAADQDWFLHFNGTNSYDSSRVAVEFYKFRFATEGGMALVHDQGSGTYTLNGSLQKDEARAANAVGGQYYRMVQPGA